ncbi:MAG TPA: hypothetical protein VKE73_08195 [Myxococcota bacterium]|nr:hypothetical protein [Myxococcota bacterium]
MFTLLAVAAHAEGPPCLTQVEVTPARAVVGQQVTYRARVMRRPDVGTVSWVQGLTFPSLRAEWLPGLAGQTRLVTKGTPYLVYEERRALFPLRAGHLEIPPASLSCALYVPPGGATRSVAVRVPAAALEVDEPPLSERPRSWSGLVGPVDAKLAAEPAAVALGDTVRVTLTLTGEGNLWAAPAPFGPASFEGSDGLASEVFAKPPALSVDPGEHLQLRQVFAFELVPRRAGRLVIPSYDLPFFDPARHRFAALRTEALEISVARSAGEGAPHTGTPPAAGSSAASIDVKPRGSILFVLGGLAALVLGGSAAVLAMWRRTPEPSLPMYTALQDAARARRTGDEEAERRALVRALRAGVERALFPAERAAAHLAKPALSVDELAARAQGDDVLVRAAEILRADERARFAAGGEGPDTARLRAAVDSLARRP